MTWHFITALIDWCNFDELLFGAKRGPAFPVIQAINLPGIPCRC